MAISPILFGHFQRLIRPGLEELTRMRDQLDYLRAGKNYLDDVVSRATLVRRDLTCFWIQSTPAANKDVIRTNCTVEAGTGRRIPTSQPWWDLSIAPGSVDRTLLREYFGWAFENRRDRNTNPGAYPTIGSTSYIEHEVWPDNNTTVGKVWRDDPNAKTNIGGWGAENTSALSLTDNCYMLRQTAQPTKNALQNYPNSTLKRMYDKINAAITVAENNVTTARNKVVAGIASALTQSGASSTAITINNMPDEPTWDAYCFKNNFSPISGEITISSIRTLMNDMFLEGLSYQTRFFKGYTQAEHQFPRFTRNDATTPRTHETVMVDIHGTKSRQSVYGFKAPGRNSAGVEFLTVQNAINPNNASNVEIRSDKLILLLAYAARSYSMQRKVDMGLINSTGEVTNSLRAKVNVPEEFVVATINASLNTPGSAGFIARWDGYASTDPIRTRDWGLPDTRGMGRSGVGGIYSMKAKIRESIIDIYNAIGEPTTAYLPQYTTSGTDDLPYPSGAGLTLNRTKMNTLLSNNFQVDSLNLLVSYYKLKTAAAPGMNNAGKEVIWDYRTT